MDKVLSEAVAKLQRGGVVVFPTDTVWGVGAWIHSGKGITSLYQLKKRDPNKPTAVLVASMEQAAIYGSFTAKQRTILTRYWPGALTVVVPATDVVPHEVLNDRGGVGIRWPNDALVSDMCAVLPGGIVTSSANFAGEKPPTTFDEISSQFLAGCDLVINQNRPMTGTSSTVISMMDAEVSVLRQGEIVIPKDLL